MKLLIERLEKYERCNTTYLQISHKEQIENVKMILDLPASDTEIVSMLECYASCYMEIAISKSSVILDDYARGRINDIIGRIEMKMKGDKLIMEYYGKAAPWDRKAFIQRVMDLSISEQHKCLLLNAGLNDMISQSDMASLITRMMEGSL